MSTKALKPLWPTLNLERIFEAGSQVISWEYSEITPLLWNQDPEMCISNMVKMWLLMSIRFRERVFRQNEHLPGPFLTQSLPQSLHSRIRCSKNTYPRIR